MGVHSEGEVVFVQVPHSPQRGVLCAEELSQVFVQHKYQLCHTCSVQKNEMKSYTQAEQSQLYYQFIDTLFILDVTQQSKWIVSPVSVELNLMMVDVLTY